MRLILLILLLLIPQAVLAADEMPEVHKPPPIEQPVDAFDSIAALGYANAVMADLSQKKMPSAEMLSDYGCFHWWAPGAALVVYDVWDGIPKPEPVYMSEDRFTSYFRAQDNLYWDVPWFLPSEPADGDDGVFIESQVCLLDSEKASKRIKRYHEGYQMWVGFNEGMNATVVPEDALNVDYAVVFIDSWGSIELYFVWDEDGNPRLIHFLNQYFFDA